jgi:hypothetical protein
MFQPPGINHSFNQTFAAIRFLHGRQSVPSARPSMHGVMLARAGLHHRDLRRAPYPLAPGEIITFRDNTYRLFLETG